MFICIVALFSLGMSPVPNKIVVKAAGKIPIQYNGRIKSLDIFARETMQVLTGKQSWRKGPAVVFLLDVLSGKENLLTAPCIGVDNKELKHLMGFSDEEKLFSYNQLKSQFAVITSLGQAAQEKRDKDLRPSKLEQAAETLYGRIITVDQLYGGESLKMIPSPMAASWDSPLSTSVPMAEKFRQLLSVYAAGTPEEFNKASSEWAAQMIGISKVQFAGPMRLENLYFEIKPFFYSWIFYLLAFVLLSFCRASHWHRLGVGICLMAFSFHTLGLVLRMMVLQRAPVSNMYESMIFMNWVLMLAAGIGFLLNRKNYFFLSTGSIVSALIMIYANILPISSSLEVLMPVLRSNYWLIIHVLTIVASYGVFGLAMALGHRHLWLQAHKKLSSEAQTLSANMITHCLQIGLITLGIGTVLGGVWANESWGRFWGWDPKETWALITFLGYLAVVHLRTLKRLNDYALAVCSIIGFLLVLMTWYGVNFLLGRGLHSYGSGAGGTNWIVYYLLFEVGFFGFVILSRFNRNRLLLH